MNALAQSTPAFVPALYAAGEFDKVLQSLDHWLMARDYCGYEPYDLLNSPYLKLWAKRQPFATCFLQAGKRMGGIPIRQLLRVPPSRNPKALGLILGAYCDLSRSGWERRKAAKHIKSLLRSLQSPDEQDCCWGYDWHYVSLRGACLPAFSPNSIATVFCAEALLNHAETFFDNDSRTLALSAARWLATRLAKSVNEKEQVCFSYTPNDRTRIFNNSALVGAFLARIDQLQQLELYSHCARRALQFLANGQRPDGSWHYGESRSQDWIDSFHTGYNLCALQQYQQVTGDRAFSSCLSRGYDFYTSHFFTSDGAPRYFHDRTYPIDIHSCAQAILTFCAFAQFDPAALARAVDIARWTVAHLRNRDGSFGYQIHRWHCDRTPYLRWGQAWMLHALARLRLQLAA
jgi:hypothetical protein